jgi:anthranilate synthase component 2
MPNPDLEVLAYDNSGNIMALKHKYHDLRGLQFHPESILTENGIAMITNWVNHPIL